MDGVSRERYRGECFAATGGLSFCFSRVAIVPLVRSCTLDCSSYWGLILPTVLNCSHYARPLFSECKALTSKGLRQSYPL
uniref:Uncharacterized protein n=1 Tax=Brassica oleracea var. oleracea TaxID=109376 RepID=A0A0D3EAZ0_BRAOL